MVQKYIQDEMDIDLQRSRPVALYLNGAYWGLYNIRDRMNDGYVETYHTKYNDLPLDIIKNPTSNAGTQNVYYWVYEKVISGSKTEYYNLLNYMETTDLSIASNYEYVKTQIEMNSFIDYIIPFAFYDKFDWPANNLTVWKAGHPSSKWRWMMFDMEWIGWNGVQSGDMLYNLLENNNPNQLMHLESSTIFRSLFKNNEFKHEFIQRTNTYINSVWEAGRVQQIANDFNNEIDAEIIKNKQRWNDNWDYNTFQTEKNLTVDYITNRPTYWRSMVDNVLNVAGRINLTFNFDNNTNGHILTNSNFYSIPENYSTTYHKSVPLWIHAVPKPGYRFVEWQEITNLALKYEQSIYTSFNANKTLTPIFEPTLDLVINEIHYNPLGTLEDEEFIELHNPDNKAKSLYGYQFDNGVEFTFPKNSVINADEYIIIAKDASQYNGNSYQVFQWECGSLNNDGEMVFFSSPANEVIDSVAYNDNINWDQNADGLGYSLALIDQAQDNYQPTAWASQGMAQTTPGAANDFCITITNNAMVVDVSCYAANDGFITSQLSGGTAPFNYSWSNGASGSVLSNLAAGQYTVTITDFYNCPYTKSFTINEPPLLSATASSTNETLYQANDGAASVTVSGGTLPYTYNWSNGATTSAANNLAAGNYTVNLTDANGCPLSKTVNIV